MGLSAMRGCVETGPHVQTEPHMQTGFSLPDRAVPDLITRLAASTAVRLVSIVLFGGLTRGEWAPATSDIDLVCLLREEVDGNVLGALDGIYDNIEAADPDAYRALYVYHMPVESLRYPQFRAPGGPAGLRVGNHKRRAFSGFPMSVYDAYDIRLFGRTLYGPDLRGEFPAVTLNDLKAMTLNDLHNAGARHSEIGLPMRSNDAMDVTSTWNYVAWLCRALYSVSHPGQIMAKGLAMEWAKGIMPGWAPLLDVALLLRFSPDRVTPEHLEVLKQGFGAFFEETSRLITDALAGGTSSPRLSRPN